MKLELKWVAIIFVVHLIWHIGERAMGFYGERFGYQELAGWAFLMVYAVLILFALMDLKNTNRGFLNRRHGFLSSLFISLVLVALAPVTVGILAYFIQPDFFSEMINNALNDGEYRAYEAAAMEYNYWSFVKLYMAGYLLVGSLSGALWSFLLHKMPEPVTD